MPVSYESGVGSDSAFDPPCGQLPDSDKDARRRDALTHYSASFVKDAVGKEQIVLVPPPSVITSTPRWADPLQAGFEEARRLLDRGASVRLVAHGATASAWWPDWVRNARRLTLTELGAYRADSPVLETRQLAADVRQWLDDLFGGIVPNIPAGRAFFGSASGRLLQPIFEATTYVRGLAAAHPGATFHCLDPDWLGLPLLRAAIESEGGRLFPPPRRSVWLWAARVYLKFAYMLIRAILGQLRHYVHAAPSRARLRHLRRSGTRADIWVVLVPDWKRINAHVIDHLALPALAAGRALGVLLCTTLLPGERRDTALRFREGSDLWPGLGELLPQLDRIPVEQIVGPERFRQFWGILTSGARYSWRGARLIARSPHVNAGSLHADLSQHLAHVAALATTDVLQAIAVSDAVTRLKDRHSVAGAPIVFSSVGFIETQMADLLLQQAGAITVDFVHGTGGETWYGATENSASLRAVWTEADAESCRELRRPAVVTSVETKDFAARERRPPRRLLLLSNYVHVDWEPAGFPLEPFQLLLLDGVIAGRSAAAAQLCFRWRPHPNDDADAVARGLSRAPFLEICRSSTLDEDLAWADVVVSSPSSTAYQALAAGLPVFIHCPPALRRLPELQAISEDRKFFYPSELDQLLAPCLEKLEAGSPDALEPERVARERLFPGSAQPLLEYLMPSATPEPRDVWKAL